MIAALILLALGSTAECVESSRGEPAVWIKDNGKSHFVHLLKGEEKKCERLVAEFNAGKLSRVCGCKQLIYPGKRDRLRLKCAHIIDNKIISRTVAIYYYYDDDVSIRACHKLSRKLINDGRKKLELGRRSWSP